MISQIECVYTKQYKAQLCRFDHVLSNGAWSCAFKNCRFGNTVAKIETIDSFQARRVFRSTNPEKHAQNKHGFWRFGACFALFCVFLCCFWWAHGAKGVSLIQSLNMCIVNFVPIQLLLFEKTTHHYIYMMFQYFLSLMCLHWRVPLKQKTTKQVHSLPSLPCISWPAGQRVPPVLHPSWQAFEGWSKDVNSSRKSSQLTELFIFW